MSQPLHPLPPGTQAPDFTLHSTPDQSVSLSEFNGTPTFFINGTRYDGSWAEGDLVRALEHAAP
jgi:hypothetical protein